MCPSLQDQLLKAGLIDNKKAKKISKDLRKSKKQQRRSKDGVPDESQQAIQQSQREKQDRDRALNRKRQAEIEKKALAGRIVQLIEHYKLERTGGDVEYHFSDDSKIKKIYLAQKYIDELARGRLGLVRLETRYELIPRPIADKIRESDASVIVVCNEKSTGKLQSQSVSEDEEYYAQFEIPDDLTW